MKIDIATRRIAASAGQDRIFTRVFDDVAIVALADGAGGSAGGDVAAQALVSEISKTAQDVPDPHDEKFWVSWLKKMDELIHDHPLAGETTAVVAAVAPGRITGASVGDSSAWLIGPNHDLDVTAEQVRRPFLGSGSARARSFSVETKGEVLLLASDGLTKYADASRLHEIIRSHELEAAVEQLVEAVRLPSGSFFDDVSCILCRIAGQDTRVSLKELKKNSRPKISNWF